MQEKLIKTQLSYGCADNPLKNHPEDEIEEWLLIDEIEPVEQELTDEEIINIIVH